MQVIKSATPASWLKPCPVEQSIKVACAAVHRVPLASGNRLRQRRCQQHQAVVGAASNDDISLTDVKELASFISAQPMDDEQRRSYSGLANVLQVPLSTIKGMAYKKKGFSSLTPDKLQERIQAIAQIVEVSEDEARRMVIIQPALCFDTDKQAETLKQGIQTICWELEASKEEVVDLILENQSVLHGRKLHLSVADIAHLSMLREKGGRIVD